MTRPSKARTEATPGDRLIAAAKEARSMAIQWSDPAAPASPPPAIEVLAKGDDHNIVVIRDRAINLRDNLVRVCDGERLERARELVSRAVAVALGKD